MPKKSASNGDIHNGNTAASLGDIDVAMKSTAASTANFQGTRTGSVLFDTLNTTATNGDIEMADISGSTAHEMKLREQASCIIRTEESQRKLEEARTLLETERKRYHRECLDAARLDAQHQLICRQANVFEKHKQEVAVLQAELHKRSDTVLHRTITVQDAAIALARKTIRELSAQPPLQENKSQQQTPHRRGLFISCGSTASSCLAALPHCTEDALHISSLCRSAGITVEVLSGVNTSDSTKLNILRRVTAVALGENGSREVTIYFSGYAFDHETHGMLLVPSDGVLPKGFVGLQRGEKAVCEVDVEELKLLPLSWLLECVSMYQKVGALVVIDTVCPIVTKVSPAGGFAGVFSQKGGSFLAQYNTNTARLGHPPAQPHSLLTEAICHEMCSTKGSLTAESLVTHITKKAASRIWPIRKTNVSSHSLGEGGGVTLVQSQGVFPGVSGPKNEVIPCVLHLAVDRRIAPLLYGRCEVHRVVQRQRATFSAWAQSWLTTVLKEMALTLKQPLPSAIEITKVTPDAHHHAAATPFDAFQCGSLGRVDLLVSSNGFSSHAFDDLTTLITAGEDLTHPEYLFWGKYIEQVAGFATLQILYVRRPRVSQTREAWREKGVLLHRTETPGAMLLECYDTLQALNGKPLHSFQQGVDIHISLPPPALEALTHFTQSAAGRLWDAVPTDLAKTAQQCKQPFDLFLKNDVSETEPLLPSAVLQADVLPNGMEVSIRDEGGYTVDAWVDGVYHVLKDGVTTTAVPGELRIVDEEVRGKWEEWGALSGEEKEPYLRRYGEVVKVRGARDVGCEAELRSVSSCAHLHLVHSVARPQMNELLRPVTHFVVFVWKSAFAPTPPETVLSRMRSVAKAFTTAAAVPVAFFFYCAGGGEEEEEEGGEVDFGFGNKNVNAFLAGPAASSVMVCERKGFFEQSKHPNTQVSERKTGRTYLMRPNSAVLERDGLFSVQEYHSFISAVLAGKLVDIGARSDFVLPKDLAGMNVGLI